MNVVLRARAMSTLGGATELATFTDHDNLKEATAHLMDCHPHHFAVLQDGHCTLVVSPMAITCLRTAGFQIVSGQEE